MKEKVLMKLRLAVLNLDFGQQQIRNGERSVGELNQMVGRRLARDSLAELEAEASPTQEQAPVK